MVRLHYSERDISHLLGSSVYHHLLCFTCIRSSLQTSPFMNIREFFSPHHSPSSLVAFKLMDFGRRNAADGVK